MNIAQTTLAAITLAAGLAGGGYFIGNGIRTRHETGRHVTVKGLSERVVSSNQASLTIYVQDSQNDRAATFQPVGNAQKKIVEILKKAGFKDEEITLGQWSTEEAKSDYSDEELKLNPKLPRKTYITKANIVVETKNVAAVQSVYRSINDLISQTNGTTTGASVNYAYTDLGSIRAEMIAAATKDARNAALQFAADSGSKVGAIREASQGVFSIKDKGSSDDAPERASEKVSALEKVVRVVTSVDYQLTE